VMTAPSLAVRLAKGYATDVAAMPTSSFLFEPDPVQLDAEGYAPSFKAEENTSFQTFFDRYGFVVIRDVLSAEDVSRTTADIFTTAGFADSRPPTLEALDTKYKNWDGVSGSHYNTKKGFLTNENPMSEVAWANRISPALYHVNKQLFGRDDLVVKVDRYGLMRPTRFGPDVIRETWETSGQWIHWDMNPWEEPDFARIQAVLAISDHRLDTGGFHCVPGFCRHWQAWAQANMAFTDAGLVTVPEGDSMRPHLQKIPMRAGSVVLWDSRTPHGNFPNQSGSWRLCQYLGFHPAPTIAQSGIVKGLRLEIEHEISTGRIPTSAHETPLSARLIGLEPWEGGAPHVINEYTMGQFNFMDVDANEADCLRLPQIE